MKRKAIASLIVIVVIVSVAAFSGCIEDKSKTIRVQPSVTTPTPTSTQIKNLDESKTIGCMRFTVLKYENFERKQQYAIPMAEGAKEIVIKVKAENVGEIRCDVPEISCIALHYKGDIMQPRWVHQIGEYPPEKEQWFDNICGGIIYPGVSREGWIRFRVPKKIDMSKAYLVLNYHGTTTKWKLG